MEIWTAIEIASLGIGLILTVLLALFPRFGIASWLVSLTVAIGAASVGVVLIAPLLGWRPEDYVRSMFATLLLAGTSGWLSTYAIERADYLKELKSKRWFFSAFILMALLMSVGL